MKDMTFKEMEKYVAEMSKYKRKCKCDHVKTVLPKHINPKGYEICGGVVGKYFTIKKNKRDMILKRR